MENHYHYTIEKINSLFSKFISSSKSSHSLAHSYFRVLVSQLNPFSAHVIYFLFLSLFGFVAMQVLNPSIKALDLFFTSVSAATVSSMSTVEMEVFSNTQLLIMTILMLLGGEIFTSMIGLQLMKLNKKKADRNKNQVDSVGSDPESLTSEISLRRVELDLFNHPHIDGQKPYINLEMATMSIGNEELKCKSIKCLILVVLCYLLVIHIFGSTLVSIYISMFSSARQVLKKKGINLQTFSVFLTVSTFANCGFTPTNENMMIFSKNSGLLLILIPQILLGNTLFAPCLYFLLWVLNMFTKKEEFSYLLKNHRQVGYAHLLPKLQCLCIAGTALGFIAIQFVLFCSLEWNTDTTLGLSSYEKFVGSLFQVVNSRHAGESVFDLSIVSSAILVLFVVMMYLPSYTSFCPTYEEITKDSSNGRKVVKGKNKFKDYILFPQLSCLVTFIILVCITERDKMKSDPLNFNVLSITLEVISAYGNVGFSMGYSCKRQLKHDNQCRDAMYGLVGRWSNNGKFILIIVMLFGRLKNFTKECGKAWN